MLPDRAATSRECEKESSLLRDGDYVVDMCASRRGGTGTAAGAKWTLTAEHDRIFGSSFVDVNVRYGPCQQHKHRQRVFCGIEKGIQRCKD